MECSNYCIIYTGKVDNLVTGNLATNIVMRVVDQLPAGVNQGRNVTYDRYIFDLNLSKVLLERKMSSLDVVDHKRCFVSRELKLVRKSLHSLWFHLSRPTAILSYHAKEKK